MKARREEIDAAFSLDRLDENSAHVSCVHRLGEQIEIRVDVDKVRVTAGFQNLPLSSSGSPVAAIIASDRLNGNSC